MKRKKTRYFCVLRYFRAKKHNNVKSTGKTQKCGSKFKSGGAMGFGATNKFGDRFDPSNMNCEKKIMSIFTNFLPNMPTQNFIACSFSYRESVFVVYAMRSSV